MLIINCHKIMLVFVASSFFVLQTFIAFYSEMDPVLWPVYYVLFLWSLFVNFSRTFFIIKPTRCTNFTILFWHETLHFSDSSGWLTAELSETSRVSCQNKFVKLVHLVGFIIKKFLAMQRGHRKVKCGRTLHLLVL
jgi:hypothetical protein